MDEIQRIAKYFYFFVYATIFYSLFFYEDDIVLHVSILLLFNCLGTLLYCIYFSGRSNEPFFFISYNAFVVAFVFKGFAEYFFGLNTDYVILTIGKSISVDGFLASLLIVSIAHFILLFIIIGLSFFRFVQKPFRYRFLSANGTVVLIAVLLLYVLISSAIMMHFGVGVMGTEGVSLPYKLSGLLFYSRTLLLPIILLRLIFENFLKGRSLLAFFSVFCLIVLLLSEVYVRATKGPLFYGFFYFFVLYVSLQRAGAIRKFKLKFWHGIVCLVLVLWLWPFIEMYRYGLLGLDNSLNIGTAINNSNSFFDYLTYGLGRLSQRMLGFLQFAGIYSDPSALSSSLSTVFSYDSLGQYYTRYYLGNENLGHLSSPSLLGVVFIISENWWYMFFSLIVIFFYMLWRLSVYMGPYCVSAQCLMSVEIFNGFIAGTADNSIKSMLSILALAYILNSSYKMLAAIKS